uniref:UDENN domain-containing protein n=1 Tax=Rhabditophanes sp. KR3021 TaxID=114890 RepID=A0AC35U6E5_9BILA
MSSSSSGGLTSDEDIHYSDESDCDNSNDESFVFQMEKKYLDNEEALEFIEMFGISPCHLAVKHCLELVILNRTNISCIGNEERFASMVKNVCDLDLGWNNIHEWKFLLVALQHLPLLQCLNITSSRLKPSPDHLLDVFVEVGFFPESNGDVSKDALYIYPSTYNESSILNNIKQFCFPWKSPQSQSSTIQLFTFVLTDGQGYYTYGYCRFNPTSNTCICLLSSLPWHNFYYKLLNFISEIINNGEKDELNEILQVLHDYGLPPQGSIVKLDAGELGKIEIGIPFPGALESMQNDKFLMEFYNAMEEKDMIKYYNGLLKERRVIITGTKMSQICACCFAVDHLLYPFNWQNLFIPILPHSLLNYLSAPMPFIMGVHKSTFDSIRASEISEAIIYDIDKKLFSTPFEKDVLPPKLNSFLKSELNYLADNFLTESLTRVFLRANVLLFGRYRQGLKKADGSSIVSWNRNIFIEAQHNVIKEFSIALLGKDGVQYFERFVDERVSLLNEGLSINDEFEKEFCRLDNNTGKIFNKSGKDMFDKTISNFKQTISQITKQDGKSVVKKWTAKAHKRRTASPICSSPVIISSSNPSSSPVSQLSSSSSNSSHPNSNRESGIFASNSDNIIEDLISFDTIPMVPSQPPPVLSPNETIKRRQNWEMFE